MADQVIFERYWSLIQDNVHASTKNPKHVYINFNMIGQKLTTQLIMKHLEEILTTYDKMSSKLYVMPQLGFFLYNTSGNSIEKYFYASANTSIFTTYRLLSPKTMTKLEKYVQSLAVKDFPYWAKQNAMERSAVGITLIANITYNLLIV